MEAQVATQTFFHPPLLTCGSIFPSVFITISYTFPLEVPSWQGDHPFKSYSCCILINETGMLSHLSKMTGKKRRAGFSVSRAMDIYRHKIKSAKQHTSKFSGHAPRPIGTATSTYIRNLGTYPGYRNQLLRIQQGFSDELLHSPVVKEFNFINSIALRLTLISFANVPIKSSAPRQVLLIIPYHWFV